MRTRYRITIKTADGEARSISPAYSPDEAIESLSARSLMAQNATVIVKGNGKTRVYIPCRCQECGTVVMDYSLCPCLAAARGEGVIA